ncbi:MAG: hypothetical protein ABIG10_03395 [bacterium]
MRYIILFLITTMLAAGCSLSLTGGTDNDGVNGGLFKTATGGSSWHQPVLISSTSGKPGNIANLNVVSLVMDPSDSQAIYYGSLSNGLFYTYSGAGSWRRAIGLGQIPIGDIAVDAKNKCVIYVVSNSKVFKSEDCSRNWSEIYSDNDPRVIFTSVVVDYYDPSNVFIANTRGDIIKSSNSGQSWQTLYNFGATVKKVLISPHDSRIMMVATTDKGIFRSMNNGQSWVDLNQTLKEFNNSKKVRDIIASKKQAGMWLLATEYGLLQSVNNGDGWTNIELILPERRSIINAIGMSYQNVNKIYYVTNTTFYSSIDEGVNWTSRELPTARRGWRLLVDPDDDNIVYLGVSQKP